MSFEVVEKLETKIQQAINTITQLKVEITALNEQNLSLLDEISNESDSYEALIQENQQLKQEQQAWQERLRTLLGKMEDI